MIQKFLIPKSGLIIRDPLSMTPLPEKGGLVDYNSFWRRRVKDKDASIPTEKELEKLLKDQAEKREEDLKKALEKEADEEEVIETSETSEDTEKSSRKRGAK